MKDIKELIYAAVEENAVAFQELAGSILQARAYDAIEALRPEVGASMFGEAKECSDDEEDEEVEELDEISTKTLAHAARAASDPDSDYLYGKSHDAQKFADHAKKTKDAKSAAAVQGAADGKGHYPRYNVSGRDKLADRTPSRVTASGKMYKQDASSLKRKMKEEVQEEVEQIDEVDHPKNQADMLAHIMHQIKVTGHPVATDAQFRATHGKDTTKIASLEPGQDKLQYAVAQGGNVKP